MEENLNEIVSFDANGETVELSLNQVAMNFVSGGGQITVPEAKFFLNLCRYQHLNPFIRDAYLIKYGNSQPAAMVVGKDAFLKRAERNKDYKGSEAGVIVLDKDGNMIERQGSFVLNTETLVGGWAKVYRANKDVPSYSAVSFDEYAGRKKDGSLNSQWSGKPATMIRKVALCQALREAFPEDFQGLYGEEEIRDDHILSVEEAVKKDISDNANSVEFHPEDLEVEAKVVEPDVDLTGDEPPFA